MTTKETPSLAQPLPDGLILRTARDEDDIERLAQFNGVIHSPDLIPMVRGLAAHYPGMEYADWVFVEDESSGEVVSSLCLIPWTLRYGRVDLRVAEMGLVGTTEAYRRRGLVRIQVDYFKQRMAERGALLSLIQGIPYYYRQFGYEYALPLEGGLRMSGRELPDWTIPAFSFRRAGIEDLPILQRLYDEAAADVEISVVRNARHWRYLLEHPQATERIPELWLVLDEKETVVGYFMLPEHHFGEELTIGEVSRLSFDAALAVLRRCREIAAERHHPGIRLNLPANSAISQLARAVGAHDLGTYFWQIHVSDFADLLRAIAPVLEERLATSPFAGMTRDLPISFYRSSVILRFVNGQVSEVMVGGPVEGPVNFPPLTIIPLIFGQRAIADLRAAHPDVNAGGVWRLLMETLFPQRPAFLYSGY